MEWVVNLHFYKKRQDLVDSMCFGLKKRNCKGGIRDMGSKVTGKVQGIS